MTVRSGALTIALVAVSFAAGALAQSAQTLPDAVAASSKVYTVEFENDIVRVLRVRLGVGDSVPRHSHPAYCAIEISDSSLREGGNGPVSESKAGQVFCGDATSHAPANVGKALAESIVVEFKGRQKAR
jgi:hypothetical protein